ncbi:MAG: TspO/MBR family protein [Patescibacteria group bacterium]
MKKALQLILAIAVCQMAGGVGSLFTYPQIASWYQGIEKSSLNPPNWIFGPVWFSLFTIMGVCLWLIWQNRKNKFFKIALTFFVVQLVLNSLWSVLFFGYHLVLVALIEMIIFWIMILLSGIYCYKINKIAGWLFVPYLIWVSFATYLTYAVLVLN